MSDYFDLCGPDAALLVKATGVQDQILPADHLTVDIHFDHQNCPNADLWRAESGEGFPKFKAVLHERYNRSRTYLRCEACPALISHTIVHSTKTESA